MTEPSDPSDQSRIRRSGLDERRDGAALWLRRWQRPRGRDILSEAGRVAPSTFADTRHLPGLWSDVVHDIVRMSRVACKDRRDAGGHVIEIQKMTRPPRDVVIRARCVAADAKTTQQASVGVVESKPAAKYVD